MLVLLLSSAWALPALPVPVVHGDFDNDGYTDTAQGFPDASDGAGRVDVFWGNPAARVAWPTVLSPVMNPSSMMNAGAFGASLAVGDFDGDGIDDLAVGAPDADPTWLKGSTTNAGAVTVLYGCAVTCASIDADGAGLPAVGSALDPSAGAQRVFQHAPWGAAVAGMALGSAVAAGDFDGDGFDDLAAGAPGDTVGGDADAGSVVVVYGGPSGVDTSSWQKLQQDLLPPGDTIAEPGDAFGTAVVAARVDGDARDDLVVGAPYEDYTVSGVDQTDAGEIDVFWGDALGLSGSNYDRFRHASATVGGSRQHDHLGIALSAIDAWWLFTGTVFGQLDEAASCGGDPAFLTIPGGAIGDPAPAVVLNCEPDVCDAGYAAGDGELEPLPLRVLVIANAATVAAADLPTLPSATWAGVDPITGEALSGTDWAHAEVDLLNQQVRGDDGDPVCDGYDCVRFTFLSRRWWSTSMFGSPAGSVCPKLHALSDPYHNTLGESPLAFATDCDSTSCPISSGTTRYADLSAFAEAAVDECASLIDEEAMNLIIYDACRRGAGADGVVGTADDALDCAGERDGRARVNSHVPYAYVDYDRALQARQPSGSGFPWAAEDHEMGHALGLQHACDPAGHGGSTHTMQTGSCTDGLGDRSGGFSTTSRVDVLGATVVEVDEMVDMAVQHAQAWGCP